VEVDLSQAWMQRDAIFDDVLPGAWSDYSPGVLDKLQLMWDSMNNNWQSMIIDFDAENQHDFFSKLGFPNMTIRDLANGLLAFALLVMAVTTGLFLRRRTKLDKVAVSYNKLSRKLGRVGFDRSATEGPVDYIQRVIDNRPELEDKLKPILQLYINLRFRESKQGDLQQKQFSKRINEFTLKQK